MAFHQQYNKMTLNETTLFEDLMYIFGAVILGIYPKEIIEDYRTFWEQIAH